MAINFTSGSTSLFARLGRCGRALLTLQTAQAQLTPDLAAVLGRFSGVDQSATAPLALTIAGVARTVPAAAFAQLLRVAEQAVLMAVAADRPARAESLDDALAEVVRQMAGGAVSVAALSPTAAASPGTGPAPTGDGFAVATLTRADGLVNQLAPNEVVTLGFNGAASCVAAGEPNDASPADHDWPKGSAARTTIPVADARDSGTRGVSMLANGGFDEWPGSDAAPAAWEHVNVTREASLVYGSGVAARVAAGDSATLTQTAPRRQPEASRVIAVGLWLRGTSALTAGTLTASLVDPAGTLVGVAGTVTLAGVGTAYGPRAAFLRTPGTVPAGTRLRLAVAGVAGGAVLIDHAAAVPVTGVSPGGVGVAAFAGSVPWAAGDEWSVAVAGSPPGLAWSQLFDRLFGLRQRGLLLPSSGSPTVPATLITDAN